MKLLKQDIEILSAPSILGLTPSGVQELGKSLLAYNLAKKLQSIHPVMQVPTLNHLYNDKRDSETNCLNATLIRDFSITLCNIVSQTIHNKRFACVLGGDCSILLGIMAGLKTRGTYGLLFLDAHADFYAPEQSTTGQVADMDLAIVTGRGPQLLTNINHLQPYVADEHVIHIGQRDAQEAKKYGSADIQETAIKCFDLASIEHTGMKGIITEVLQYMNTLAVEGFWIHYDTDVLSDESNPAVDYRLPGGLGLTQVEQLIKSLLATGRIAGISVTIFNPRLDNTGKIAKSIAESLGRTFDISSH